MVRIGIWTPKHLRVGSGKLRGTFSTHLRKPGKTGWFWMCTRWGPLTTISGFIPSYTHLQPWSNRVCWRYNYLITRGAPSCRGMYFSLQHFGELSLTKAFCVGKILVIFLPLRVVDQLPLFSYCWWFRIPKQPPRMYKIVRDTGINY